MRNDSGNERDKQVSSVKDVGLLLKIGEVTSCRPLPSGSNYTFLITLAHQDQELQAIYKPQRGERPLWDFPDGTLYKREYATFLVCETLGWGFVPTTAIRDGPYGVGSMQAYIEVEPESHYFTLKDSFRSEMLRIAAFDCLVNNADRKAGHCLKGLDGHIWAIDHGLTFHYLPKLRTVIWDFAGELFPKDVMNSLHNLLSEMPKPGGLLGKLSTLLDGQEVRAFQRRAMQMIESPTYPSPTSYRDVPWPLV